MNYINNRYNKNIDDYNEMKVTVMMIMYMMILMLILLMMMMLWMMMLYISIYCVHTVLEFISILNSTNPVLHFASIGTFCTAQ